MSEVTPPEMGRRLGEPRSRIERWLSQYAHELPIPRRVGHYRLYPPEIIDRLRNIRTREASSTRICR